MATLKDVAATAGVSTATVSAALHGKSYVKPETARRVMEAARKLDYAINPSASALRSGRSNILSLVVPRLDAPYYPLVTTYLSQEITKRGLQMMIHMSEFNEQKERHTLKQLTQFSDGIFTFPASVKASRLAAIARQCPIIQFDDRCLDRLLDTINTQSTEGMRAAVCHLAANGCQRIGILGKWDWAPQDDPNYAGRVSSTRPNAALQALKELGLPHDDTVIRSLPWSVEDGISIAHQLYEEGSPFDGVVCMNDAMALGVLRGFADVGVKVPDQVAVIGFDGVKEGAYSVPRLSTIEIDYKGMAQTAVSLMLQRIEHRRDEPYIPQKIYVGFELKARESTAR